MPQVTWRANDDLLDRVRHAATRSGRSVNEWITRVLDAATDPSLSGTDAERIRERLARAGLLAEPPASSPPRPDPADVAAARARAGEGTPLSELVTDGRR